MMDGEGKSAVLAGDGSTEWGAKRSMMSVSRPGVGRRALLRSALAAGLLAGSHGVRAQASLKLEDVNRMDEAAFVKAFAEVYDAAPWVAKSAHARRPFATVAALHQALADSFAHAPREQRLKFLHDRAELGEKGMNGLEAVDQDLLRALNKGYRAKFDMAFAICVPRNTPETIFSAYERRMKDSLDAELAAATQEWFYITRLRIAGNVAGPGMPKVQGDISAHVLDSTVGKPAAGVVVEIHELWGDRSRKVAQATSDADGRATLLSGEPLPIGRYELRFFIGDYFRKSGAAAAGAKPFFDMVPMRAFISNAEDSYHFPLIAAPFGYSIHG